MRLPGVRFRLSMLMALVMLAGVGLGGYTLWCRSAEFKRLAKQAEMHLPSERIILRIWGRRLARRDDFREDREAFENELTKIGEQATILSPEQAKTVREDMQAIEFYRRMEEKSPVEVERSRLRVDHFERLKLKYQHAAARPWLPVAPDPPEPE